jgi:hypothetical protein
MQYIDRSGALCLLLSGCAHGATISVAISWPVPAWLASLEITLGLAAVMSIVAMLICAMTTALIGAACLACWGIIGSGPGLKQWRVRAQSIGL